MATMLISSEQKDYHEFLTEVTNTMEKHEVHSIAVVIMTDDGALTGYYNMTTEDKAAAECHIRSDVMDDIINANKERYWGEDD